MQILPTVRLLILFLVFSFLSTPLYGSETIAPSSYLHGGIGFEQLTYHEQITSLELTSSDTRLTSWVLHVEGQKAVKGFFLGAKGYLPLATDTSREYWTRRGEFAQSNALTYLWIRADTHVGYFLHPMLNPYIGIQWTYAEQERSSFDNGSAGILDVTATEEAAAFSALFGFQGVFPLAARWAFSYAAEYSLPFYAKVTNSSLPGWEATNIRGYSYALTGRLHYAFSGTAAASLQVAGGRQHWEGSDWIQAGGFRAMWPENDTDFINCFISIFKYF